MLAVACGRTGPELPSQPAPTNEPTPVPGTPKSQYVAFAADGDVLDRFEAYAVDVSSESNLEPERVSNLADPEADVVHVAWSPDGRFLDYGAGDALTATDADLQFSSAWTVPCSVVPTWSATRHFMQCVDRDTNVLHVFDATSGASAASLPVDELFYLSNADWSPVGERLLVQPAGKNFTTWVVVDPGGTSQQFQVPPMTFAYSEWSRDAGHVAVVGVGAEKTRSVWVASLSQDPPVAEQVAGPAVGSLFEIGWGGALLFTRLDDSLLAIDVSQQPPVTSVVSDSLSTGWWLSGDGSVIAYATAGKLTFASIEGTQVLTIASVAVEDAGTVEMDPVSRHALIVSDKFPKRAWHASIDGGPVTALVGSDERVAWWVRSPDGRHALLVVDVADTQRLLQADFEPVGGRTVFEADQIGSLEWVAPSMFSFKVGETLYLGFADGRPPVPLYVPLSNLRKLGMVAWQPQPRPP